MPSKTRKASRKSPSESATTVPAGTVATGLDGKKWIVERYNIRSSL